MEGEGGGERGQAVTRVLQREREEREGGGAVLVFVVPPVFEKSNVWTAGFGLLGCSW